MFKCVSAFVSTCACTRIYKCWLRPEEAVGPLELGSQVGVSHLMGGSKN